MRQVGIVGVGHTKFGKWEGTFLELITQAALQAMDDAGAKTGKGNVIDQVFVASMGAGMLNRISGSASALVDTLNIRPAMAECIENGPASGASAIKLGYMGHRLRRVRLRAGGRRRADAGGIRLGGHRFRGHHAPPHGEYPYGLTLPSFAGMFTRLRFEKYGETSEDLARISVKNHDNATHNPCAHIQRKVKLERISDPRYVDATSPMVADPLRQFDMCPVSDGAAAVLLVAKDKQEELGFGHKTFARIAGIASATDTHYVADRADPTELLAVRTARRARLSDGGDGTRGHRLRGAARRLPHPGTGRERECGLFPKGEAHLAVRRGETEIGGRIPINTSGGLKAKGHPLGATGVSQVVELVRQVRGEAEGRQVEGARTGLAVNFGGFGNNVVATIVTTK